MKDKSAMGGRGINWNHVFYFSEVASLGSIKEAAPRLGLSASTLSEHIGQLESDLGVQLFLRQHRKLSLTPEGSRLFVYAKQMFETGQRLIDVVSPLNVGDYPVSIGLVPSPSVQVGYQFIRAYAEAHGPLNMKFFHSDHDDLEKGLLGARFDFGFSDRPAERKSIHHHLVSTSHIRFYVAADLAEEDFSGLVKRLPLLVCHSDLGSRSPIEQTLEDAELKPEAVMRADYPSLLLDLCQAGLGIAAFSEEAVNRMPMAREMIKPAANAPRLTHRLHALWARDGENSEAVKRLKSLLEGGTQTSP